MLELKNGRRFHSDDATQLKLKEFNESRGLSKRCSGKYSIITKACLRDLSLGLKNPANVQPLLKKVLIISV